jgi:hypothetical protein
MVVLPALEATAVGSRGLTRSGLRPLLTRTTTTDMLDTKVNVDLISGASSFLFTIFDWRLRFFWREKKWMDVGVCLSAR